MLNRVILDVSELTSSYALHFFSKSSMKVWKLDPRPPVVARVCASSAAHSASVIGLPEDEDEDEDMVNSTLSNVESIGSAKYDGVVLWQRQ
jgi:hypothetical protein